MPRVGDELPLLRRLRLERSTTRTARSAATGSGSPSTPPASSRSSRPWNAPLMLATWRIGPALAAGNTVVAKPPEWAPLTASLLADIAHEAGLPAGVFNVVQGTGAEAGAPLTRPPGHQPALLHRLGADRRRDRRAAAAPNIVPLSFELGGKSPAARLRRLPTSTSPSTSPSSSSTTPARSASAPSGILVEDSLDDASSRRVVERAPALVQGDPRDEATDVIAPGQPHPLRAGRRLRASGRSPTAPGRCSAAAPNDELGGLYFRPDDPDRRRARQRDPDRGGVRPGADRADLRHRGARRWRWPTTPGSGSPPPW